MSSNNVTPKSYARPVIRRAVLSRLDPPTTYRNAKRYAKLLSELFSMNQDEYKTIVAKAARCDLSEIHLDSIERIREKEEGRAIVVDHPRIYSTLKSEKREKVVNFETRITTAFCLDKRSTKSWARVGIYHENFHYRSAIKYENLKEKANQFNEIAEACSKWSFRMMQEYLTKNISNLYLR